MINTLPCYLDGPYGTALAFDHHDVVLLIAGKPIDLPSVLVALDHLWWIRVDVCSWDGCHPRKLRLPLHHRFPS